MEHRLSRRVVGLLALGAVAALAPSAMAHGNGPRAEKAGNVYVLTNQVDSNAVAVYDRGADGSLTAEGVYPTGGAGTAASLASQGAIVLAEEGRLVLAVNAGSDTISSFRVRRSGLQLVDVEPSGGDLPTSIAYEDGLAYVVNAGAPNSISGFRVRFDGELYPIAGSTRALSAEQTAPGQISFVPHGRALVVTEKGTSSISTFALRWDGRPGDRTTVAASGVTPYGFDWAHGNHLIVSNAGGASGASSYDVSWRGDLTPITASLPNGQRAACWTVVTDDGRFAYTTNAGTSNITGYRVARDGSLSLLDPSGISATTVGGPSDAALSTNGRYLYARIGSTGSIAAFEVGRDGSLTAIAGVTGLPAGFAGLAAD
jgi:6-phosphogluconolactonase (cycloisomerase 2 family)